MKKALCLLLLVLTLGWAGGRAVQAHCEIPCGIYDDKMRVAMLYEHATTVEKSMNQILELAKNPTANANQLVRWVNNKEEHCDRFQQIVTQYFMTQRIKPAPVSDPAAYKTYVARLSLLHEMLIHAMKAKQTTDVAHVEQLRRLIGEFSEIYFSEDDLKHIREQLK